MNILYMLTQACRLSFSLLDLIFFFFFFADLKSSSPASHATARSPYPPLQPAGAGSIHPVLDGEQELRRSFVCRQSSFPRQLQNSSDSIPGIWKESQVAKALLLGKFTVRPFKNRTANAPVGRVKGKAGDQLGYSPSRADRCALPSPRKQTTAFAPDPGWQRWLKPTSFPSSSGDVGVRRRLVRPPLFSLPHPPLGNKVAARGERLPRASGKAKPEAQLEPPGERASRASFARPLD